MRPVRPHFASRSPSPSRGPVSPPASDPSVAWRSCDRPKPDAPHAPKARLSPSLRRCATANSAVDATAREVPLSLAVANVPAICSQSSGSPRSDGTASEHWRLLPMPTSQTPISYPSVTPRGTASDSLLDSLSKVSTMSPNIRPPCPRSEHKHGARERTARGVRSREQSPNWKRLHDAGRDLAAQPFQAEQRVGAGRRNLDTL